MTIKIDAIPTQFYYSKFYRVENLPLPDGPRTGFFDGFVVTNVIVGKTPNPAGHSGHKLITASLFAYESVSDGKLSLNVEKSPPVEWSHFSSEMTKRGAQTALESDLLFQFMVQSVRLGALSDREGLRFTPGTEPKKKRGSRIASKTEYAEHPDAVVSSKLGTVAFGGFDDAAIAKGPHSFDSIVSAVMEAISSAYRSWDGWVPKNLRVFLMDHKSTRGVAVPQGKGSQLSRTIGFSKKLITEYDLSSIIRTAKHELAHVKRFDEGSFVTSSDSHGGHDARFCELLSMIDPVVAAQPAERCRYFTDDYSEEVVKKAIASKGGGLDVQFVEFVSKKTSSSLVVHSRSGKKTRYDADIDKVISLISTLGRSTPVHVTSVSPTYLYGAANLGELFLRYATLLQPPKTPAQELHEKKVIAAAEAIDPSFGQPLVRDQYMFINKVMLDCHRLLRSLTPDASKPIRYPFGAESIRAVVIRAKTNLSMDDGQHIYPVSASFYLNEYAEEQSFYSGDASVLQTAFFFSERALSSSSNTLVQIDGKSPQPFESFKQAFDFLAPKWEKSTRLDLSPRDVQANATLNIGIPMIRRRLGDGAAEKKAIFGTLPSGRPWWRR